MMERAACSWDVFKLCEIASLEHRRASCFRRFRYG
jgi:hypothetical protein